MIKLSYLLTEDELSKYYQMILKNSDSAKTPKIIALIWGPTLFGALVLLSKLLNYYHQIFVYAALMLSVIWVIFIYPKVYDHITMKVVKKKYHYESDKIKKVEVTEENGNFIINGVNRILDNYFGYENLIILNFNDNYNLIVPDRVFENEDVLKQFIKDIMLKVNMHKESQ